MRYRLVAWEDRHAIRRLERYDATTEAIRQADRRDRRHDVAKHRLALALAPLTGLLPGEIQKQMERDFGAPAVLMTIVSAVPLFLLGALGMIRTLAGLAGGALALPGWLAPPAVIAIYLCIESALRLASAIGSGEPMGTLAAAVALAIWKAAHRAPRTPGLPASETLSPEEEDSRDRELFHLLEPALALLSPTEQQTLARRFGFDAIGWGRKTAILLLAAAAANTLYAFAAFAPADGFFREILWSLPALALAGEQVRRLRCLNAGQPAGSFLAPVVRRFAKRLFAPSRTPAA